MRRKLDLSPGDLEMVVLSHGHWDHTTGMAAWRRRSAGSQLPGAHPPRVLEPPAGRAERPRSDRAAVHQPGALEGAGFAIVERQQPSFLLDGSLLVTGEVDRTTDFERGALPARQAYRRRPLAARIL